MKSIIMPGDIFCTRNPMALGRAINALQRFNSVDDQSTYSHAGIFLDHKGTSFEALWTNKCQNAFEAYDGRQIIIGRHRGMTWQAFKDGWDGVKHHEGHIYAGWRLFLHIIPPLAKYLSVGPGVCSELTAKFLCRAGLLNFWSGVTPDYLADAIRRWDDFDVVFEGECPGNAKIMSLLLRSGAMAPLNRQPS